MRVRRTARLLLSGAFVLLVLLGFGGENGAPDVRAEEPAAAVTEGYGISIGPWLSPRSDLLKQMNMNWVKIYQISQIKDYQDHYILYRMDVDGMPGDWNAFREGVRHLAHTLEREGVDAVEIGNEMNLRVEWGGQVPNPEGYVEVLRASYNIFKREAPGIIVIMGGLAPSFTANDGSSMDEFQYAQRMINAGANRYMDAWAYHPYGFDKAPETSPNLHPFSFRRTEIMRQLLLNNGINKEIWITEFGWVRNPGEEGIDCTQDPVFLTYGWAAVDRNTQADYTLRAFQFATRNWPWAGPMFLWNLDWNTYDENYEPICSHLRWYGVLDRRGQPLPVVNALGRLPRPIFPPPRSSGAGGQPPVPDTLPEIKFQPNIGAVAHGNLSDSVEAGCAEIVRLGSFTVTITGAPEGALVEVEAANAPGRPFAWTSRSGVPNGSEVELFVDGRGMDPGLYLVAVNLRARGTERISTQVVRGWLLVHHPSRPECRQAVFGED